METNAPPLPTLPMQLMLTMGCWLSWPFALQCAKSVSPLLSGPKLKNPLPNAGQKQEKQFAAALQEEAANRAGSLFSGILQYMEAPYEREIGEMPAVWQKGNARLLDYGNGIGDADQPIVLFIPSLINRYYILDLEEERSMLRFTAMQDIHPLVLDWGKPGEFEKDFNCADYVTEILMPAIEFISKVSGQKVILAGYCMGGVMALAAAKLGRATVSGLALLATPWNFYCDEFSPFVLDEHWRETIETVIASQQQLPADLVQSLFYLTDPWIFEQKFRRFAGLNPESRAAREFIALERWVNDGVPMTAKVGQDCLLGWAQRNTLLENKWVVGGKVVNPKTITQPCFIAIPKNDHVVPYDCALALAELLPNASLINPGAGHVGMIVGTSAKRELWQPFCDWASQI